MSAPLVWMRLNTSGPDTDGGSIVELATVITDGNLDVIAESPELAVGTAPTALADVERDLIAFIGQYSTEGASPLCGSAILRDRRFIVRSMPDLHTFLHYRCVDVSTIRQLSRRWYPDIDAPAPADAPRPLAYIRESIAELRFYRDNIFRDPLGPPA